MLGKHFRVGSLNARSIFKATNPTLQKGPYSKLWFLLSYGTGFLTGYTKNILSDSARREKFKNIFFVALTLKLHEYLRTQSKVYF
jgi:hypothetical protein